MSLIAIAALAASVAAAVAADAPPPKPALEDYGKLPAIEDMALSPSGDWLAFVGLAQDQRRAVIKKLDGPGLFTFPIGKLKLRSIGWLPKDHVLVETSDTIHVDPSNEAYARSELWQSSVIDVDGGPPSSSSPARSRRYCRRPSPTMARRCRAIGPMPISAA
jgi:hypothetical protein